MPFIHSSHLYDLLLEAGIVTEPAASVRKCSIIAEVGCAVRIELELMAEKAIETLLVENLQEVAS